ncbi:unnamed protein product [Prorocentrum cordatum]|uniref:Uncharacterized protein n=1 Tax=Prorocentrum cordatum TaxID=2364126 RepID=A0ABN9RQW5_9DINO|nr:unnamed protein product [Polarella glacialis]
MTADETAHVVMLLVFLAHCFVLDENCPLRCWQKYIFRKYCTLKVLDAATFRIFQMRDFRLRVSELPMCSSWRGVWAVQERLPSRAEAPRQQGLQRQGAPQWGARGPAHERPPPGARYPADERPPGRNRGRADVSWPPFSACTSTRRELLEASDCY